MRRAVTVSIIAATLSSCALFTDRTVVSGYVWLVSKDDIRAAIAAARSGESKLRSAPIYEVTVESSSEIHVYVGHTGPYGSGKYAEVRKLAGRWRYITSWGIVVTS
jgi:hypothetical protein